jgi:hypothetical protein
VNFEIKSIKGLVRSAFFKYAFELRDRRLTAHRTTLACVIFHIKLRDRDASYETFQAI